MIVRSQAVKACKDLIEQLYKFLGRTLGWQLCKPTHVRKHDAETIGNQQFYIHKLHVLYHLWPIIRVPRNIHVFSIFKTRRVCLSPVGVTLNEHLRCLTQHYHWNITIKAPTNTTLSGKYHYGINKCHLITEKQESCCLQNATWSQVYWCHVFYKFMPHYPSYTR